MISQNNKIVQEQPKKAYATPALTIHGSVETLTQKTSGTSGGVMQFRKQ